MIHSRLSNPELTKWIESTIQEEITEHQPAYAEVNETYRRNMIAFYSAFLRKEFVELTSKLVVMDSGHVFISDYVDSDMGERKATVNVAKRFKGRSVWIMPAKKGKELQHLPFHPLTCHFDALFTFDVAGESHLLS